MGCIWGLVCRVSSRITAIIDRYTNSKYDYTNLRLKRNTIIKYHQIICCFFELQLLLVSEIDCSVHFIALQVHCINLPIYTLVSQVLIINFLASLATSNLTPQISSFPKMSKSAVKRLLQELKELENDPSPEFTACPLESDILEWHFTIRGPPEGGTHY